MGPPLSLPLPCGPVLFTTRISPLTCFLLALTASAFATRAASAGRGGSLLDLSTDGRLLACANRDSGTVSIVDVTSRRKLREVKVGSKPEGLTFLGDSHQVVVAVYAEDKVVILDADSGKRIRETKVFDEPYGVVSDAAGRRIWVTLDYPGRVVEIDAESGRISREFTGGAFLRGIALTPDERRLLVTEYYTAAVLSIDLESGKVVDRWVGASTDNLLRQIVTHPTRPKAYLPHMRSRVTAAHGEGSVFPYVSVIDIDTVGGEGRRRRRIPMDAFRGNFVVANPWEADVSPDGRTLWIVFAGTDDIFVCDIVDDSYREITYRHRVQTGHNPRAVRFAPDGETVWVYDALDFKVTAWDAGGTRQLASISVCDDPLGEEILLGKRLFYSALQPMVGRRWISCSSCHPDGDADGRTWNNPEGLRNTPSLAGLAWTHPQHWSADRDETQDFEHTIRGPLMQGRGLISGRVNDSLGSPNKGRSAELDALAAYTNSTKISLSPYAKNGLTEGARRGKKVFLSSETGCATCHTGPFYTDSTPGPRIVRHDVGTGGDDPSEKMGPSYDSPTLLGVYSTAPCLHHGKAKTLTEVLREYNREDRHGKTRHLTDAEVADLVEFLKALPHEDPEPLARKAKLRKVPR